LFCLYVCCFRYIDPWGTVPPKADHHSRIRSRSYFTTDGQSVSQYVLVSGTPLGPMTRFFFFLSFAGELLCSSSWGALWREDGSVICSAICQWSKSRRTHNHTLLSTGTTGFPIRCLAGITMEVFYPLWQEGESTICSESVSGQSRGGLITIQYCLIWDYCGPFPLPRRDYDGSILHSLTRGRVCNL
jgi:hypothetical protein